MRANGRERSHLHWVNIRGMVTALNWRLDSTWVRNQGETQERVGLAELNTSLVNDRNPVWKSS